MIAISALSSVSARSSVSFKRQRYSSVTACGENLSANRVLTEPARGALAIITNTRFVGVIGTYNHSVEVFQEIASTSPSVAASSFLVASNALQFD